MTARQRTFTPLGIWPLLLPAPTGPRKTQDDEHAPFTLPSMCATLHCTHALKITLEGRGKKRKTSTHPSFIHMYEKLARPETRHYQIVSECETSMH